MTGDSEHPVTVGDLYVKYLIEIDEGGGVVNHRRASISDLVSALRAEGWLVEPPKDPWDYDP